MQILMFDSWYFLGHCKQRVNKGEDSKKGNYVARVFESLEEGP